MPLYEYECEKCGHRFEKIQKFSDPLVKTCPRCQGKVNKLLSAPAIQFKGSGWYITDYARKSTHGPGEKEGKASGDGEKGGKGTEGKSVKEEKSSGEKKSHASRESKKKNSGD